ncbi:MAG: hypothetical protein JO252_11845, partial [Planctomycetaceae bacterium]|nr:hypothetical protein [Planctomycetaceae bacterium]
AVLIPRHNEKDLIELPAEVKSDMTFHAIDTLDDVIPRLFPAKLPKAHTARGKSAAGTGAKARSLPSPEDKPDPTPKPTRRPRSV